MASQPISPSDLLSPDAYEPVRAERVARVIALKQRRRVEVGPWVSCAFESRETVVHQIQEMIRIERLSEPSAVAHEIETFAELVPAEGELSLTLFIEISDDVLRRKALATLGGIEKTFSLKLGSHAVPAFDKRPIDPSVERPGQATAVYYLGFKLPAAMRAAFASGEGEAWLQFSHPAYRHAAALSAEQRRELASSWG